MKFKHISISICHALLPGWFDMHVLTELDSFLTEADNIKEHNGIVRKLKQRNQETQGQKPWQRILSYGIDISLVIDLQTEQLIREIRDYGATPGLARTGMNRKVDAMFSVINQKGSVTILNHSHLSPTPFIRPLLFTTLLLCALHLDSD
jgi:hypothetical protein